MVIRTEYIYELIMNTELILRLEFAILYTIPPFFGLFLERILIKRISRVTIAWSSFSLVLIALTVWPPPPFIQDILIIWQVTVFIPLSYYIGYVLFYTFIRRVKETRQKMIEAGISSSLIRAIGSTIYRTTSGNLIIGVTVAVIGLIFDILDSMFFATGVVLSQYSFFILVISIMLILANRFQYIHRRVEVLNRDLENRVEELNLAYMKIRLSEERYRMLVEGSDDIIFSMDRDGILRAANQALKKHLGMDPDSIDGTPFLDLIQELTDDRFSARVFHEKMEQLDESERPVSFRARFQTRLGAEPREMQVRLEKVSKDEGTEILGKASQVTEDILTGYFVSERLKYRIANYLMMAEDISHRITRNLKRYMAKNEIMLVRLALREIIINAIEHGNLGITYDEKTGAQEEDRYLELVAERQLDPARSDKRVEIEYSIQPERVQYRITDEGKGFDHVKYMAGNAKEANTDYHQHGRGIAMAMNVFDTIQYNNRGNQVLLVKSIQS
jgi:PAS domain S-box-containing protein